LGEITVEVPKVTFLATYVATPERKLFVAKVLLVMVLAENFGTSIRPPTRCLVDQIFVTLEMIPGYIYTIMGCTLRSGWTKALMIGG
jgi:hypothetical protein